jgi:hypothetical protein
MNEQQRAVVQQALEVIETPIHEQQFMAKQKAVTALRQLLEQPEPVQEPVAWPCVISEADFEKNTVTLLMQCSHYKLRVGQHWLHTTPPAQPAVPKGWKLVPVDALKRWRDAFAEELDAWDIDPPLHHVKTSHDEIEAMLAATPTQGETK